MKVVNPKESSKANFKLQKIKDNKYYVKVPGLKIPVILNEYLFKKWFTKPA